MKLLANLIEERNFHNAWTKAIHAVLRKGADLVIGGADERKPIKDSCMLICMTGMAIKQIEARELHPQCPFRRIEEYCNEFTRAFLEEYRSKPVNERFSYLYFDRLVHYEPTSSSDSSDQITLLKDALADQIKENITSNRSQAITWYVPLDIKRSSPPCLQRIQIRYIPENNVDVHLTWRSRDLFTAWQPNIVCIIEMLNREVIKPNNCQIVRIIDYSDSLHIYARDIEDAKKVKLVPVSPQEI
ncbi:MAG: thymidylate synthase [Candidatus Methanospirareceae archaeon]